MKVELDITTRQSTRQIIIQPGDGTRYDIVLIDDPYGGVLVIWPGDSTWRWYKQDYLKFLHGNENEFTRKAIWNYLEVSNDDSIDDI